jgi:Cu/Ag efflux protein CusF
MEAQVAQRLKLRFAVALCTGLALVAGPALASMTNIEWLTKMEQIELSRGVMADHVHAQGTVLAIDPGDGTITILHPEISSADKSIWMPAMRMVFHVTRSEVLRGVRAGEVVRFEAARRKGAVMVSRITRVAR